MSVFDCAWESSSALKNEKILAQYSIDTGSGRTIQVICHGIGVCHEVLPRVLVLALRRFHAVLSFCVVTCCLAVVVWFWEVVQAMPADDRSALLRFVTGKFPYLLHIYL